MYRLFLSTRLRWAIALLPVLLLLAGEIAPQRAAAQISGYTLSASPSTVAPGASLSVSWTAPSGRPSTDWVGLYRIGAPNESLLSWQYTGGTTSGSRTFTAPLEVGQYEFRYFLQDGFTLAARSSTVTVGSGGMYTLSASPSTVAPGGSLSVSWAAPSGRPTTDWVGLYRVGDANGAYLWWSYTNGTASGSATLTAPSQTGQYEFRYFLQDGYTLAARSNAVTVGSTTNAPPAVSITSPSNGATFTAPASITISATASDSDGTVAQVQFFQGATLLGTDTTAPYSFAWSNAWRPAATA